MTKKINFRADDGLGAFRDETPRTLKLSRSLMSAARIVSPVPMPPVPGPVTVIPDISKWQGVMDVEQALDVGVKAIWIKANQGLWIDPKFEINTQNFIDAGVIVGFYEFIDPTQTSVAPEQAAKYHYEITKDYDPQMVASSWLDGERRGDLSVYQLYDYYRRWYETLAGLANDERLVEDYTRASFWSPNVARADFWRDKKVGVNAARYHLGLSSPWSDGNYPLLDWDYGRYDFHLWQYSADGNGMGSYFGAESASIDLNLFNGDWSDFLNYYNLQSEPPTNPDCCEELSAKIKQLESQVVDLEAAILVVDTRTRENKASIGLNNAGILSNAEEIGKLDLRLTALEETNDPETLAVQVLEGVNCPVYEPDGHDQSCNDRPEPGKPIFGSHKIGRYSSGKSFRIMASGYYSCHDDRTTPEILTANGETYYIVADGEKYAGGFVPAKRVRKT